MMWHKCILGAVLALGFSSMGDVAQGQVRPASTPLQMAQSKVAASQAEIDRMERQAKADLAKQSGWIKAQQELTAAEKARDIAREEALKSTRKSAGYVAAVDTLKKSEAVIAAGNEDRATARQVQLATSDAIDARLIITQLESAALRQSPQFQEATARYDQASAALDQMWASYKADVLDGNRSYLAALASRDSADEELRTAQQSVREARAQVAAQRMNTRASDRSSRSSGSSRRSTRGY